MRAWEFIKEDMSTSSANIATVSTGLGHMPMVSRMSRPPASYKYANRPKPKQIKRNKNAS
jgi:hypothetical protein